MQVHLEHRKEQLGFLVRGEDSERAGIRVLPAETLSAIFSGLLNDSYEMNCLKYQYHSTFNPHRDLIVASHICHQWRHVALNTASLWKHVSIAYNHYSHVGAFLLRSKISRLSVHVSIMNYPGHWLDPPHPQLTVALNLVTANWHRIASLSLYLKEHGHDHEWINENWLRRFNPGREGTCVLQKLRIHGYLSVCDFSFFFYSPKLPQLALAKGLTELSLNKVTVDHSLIPHGLYELVRSSPNVEILRLCITYDNDDEEPTFDHPERISLPHLRQLFLHFRPHSVINYVLLDMDFPPDTNCEFTYDEMTTVDALQTLPFSITSSLRAPEMSISLFKFRLCTTRSIGGPSKFNITVLLDPPDSGRAKHDMINLLPQCLDSIPWTRPAELCLDLSECEGVTRAQDWHRLATCLPVLESLEIWITRDRWHEEEQALLPLLDAFAIERKEPFCTRFRRLVLPATAGDQMSEGLSAMLADCNQRREKLGLPSIEVAWEESRTKKAEDVYGYTEFYPDRNTSTYELD